MNNRNTYGGAAAARAVVQAFDALAGCAASDLGAHKEATARLGVGLARAAIGMLLEGAASNTKHTCVRNETACASTTFAESCACSQA